MMWSDMFFKMLNQDRYHDENLEITDQIRRRIPEGLELVYWDYYARDTDKYDTMMRQHKMLQCRAHGIKNVIVTGWGDDGGEASQTVVLPVLALYAEWDYEQNMEDGWIKPRLMSCTGADLDDF